MQPHYNLIYIHLYISLKGANCRYFRSLKIFILHLKNISLDIQMHLFTVLNPLGYFHGHPTWPCALPTISAAIFVQVPQNNVNLWFYGSEIMHDGTTSIVTVLSIQLHMGY